MPTIVCRECGHHNPHNTPEERFWNQVDKNSERRSQVGKEKDCWEWCGALHSKGYGKFTWNDKMSYAHRIAYEISNGTIPDNIYVCHTCDNPCCCNPDHLFLGTPLDNFLDMLQKERNPDYICKSGEYNIAAVLTEEQVLDIIEKHNTLGYRKLAEQYGVAPSTIRNIIKGKNWTHLSRG